MGGQFKDIKVVLTTNDRKTKLITSSGSQDQRNVHRIRRRILEKAVSTDDVKKSGEKEMLSVSFATKLYHMNIKREEFNICVLLVYI